jgi:polysaccharide pyruvyl transferase WcaK-like protein
VQHKSHITVIGNDRYSSEEIMGVMGRMKYFAGMRLHSLILASAMNVPCIGLAYAPKVRHFMDLMGTPEALIELTEFSGAKLCAQLQRLAAGDVPLRAAYVARVQVLKDRAYSGYRALAKNYLQT